MNCVEYFAAFFLVEKTEISVKTMECVLRTDKGKREIQIFV